MDMSTDHHHHNDEPDGPSRRRVLECMTWAGTGVLWTVAGGVPRSLGLVNEARAAGAGGLTFLQTSESHMGFDKPANPNTKGTLEDAMAKIKTLPVKPSFMIHTGDITHLSKPAEFDDADKIISQARLDVHYVPGEHDIIDEEVKLYRERYGRGTRGRRLVQLRRRRGAFRRPRQREEPQGRRHGQPRRGSAQMA